MTGLRSLTAAALAAGLLASAAAEAGPWAVGPGHYYSKLSYQHRRSTTLATPDGTRFEIPVFTQQDSAAYLAYGVRSWLTVTADLPFLRSSNLEDLPDELPRVTGIGDMRLGAQVQLGQSGPWVFAVRGLVQAPIGLERRHGDDVHALGIGIDHGGHLPSAALHSEQRSLSRCHTGARPRYPANRELRSVRHDGSR